MKIITIAPRSRLGSILLVLFLLGAGVVLLTLGFALLAGLAVVGTVLGAGAAIYYRLRGGPRGHIAPSDAARGTLDPAQEVFPTQDSAPRLPPRSDR